ncbi:MAG: hypothetical protein RIG56_14835, partial [Thalassobaculum sp.]
DRLGEHPAGLVAGRRGQAVHGLRLAAECLVEPGDEPGPEAGGQRRRRTHRVARADGPERLAPEWWRPWAGTGSRTTRDYFRVEDTEGHRFWLYREGLYDRPGDSPRWFLHGVFG